jgi:hypothetical protein
MVTRRAPSARSAREGFTAANRAAADIILASEAKYGGEGSGLVQWARLVIERAAPRIEGPLFAAADRRRAA